MSFKKVFKVSSAEAQTKVKELKLQEKKMPLKINENVERERAKKK